MRTDYLNPFRRGLVVSGHYKFRISGNVTTLAIGCRVVVNVVNLVTKSPCFGSSITGNDKLRPLSLGLPLIPVSPILFGELNVAVQPDFANGGNRSAFRDNAFIRAG